MNEGHTLSITSMIPAVSIHAYDAARRRAGLIERTDRGRIVVSGKDRASYLQGLLTNDVVALGAGEGCYAAYLTPQGRMITDLWVYELGDVILLTLSRDVKDLVLAKLDQFIFTEDVQLGDVTDTFAHVAIVGPEAAALLAPLVGLDRDAIARLREHGNLRAQFEGQPAIVLQVSDTGEPGFDVLVDRAAAGAVRQRLLEAGAVELDERAREALRIEAGVPRFHADMDEETIPLEAGIESRAISLTKGCYVGQEVIIRVLHRGHGRVARRLVGLTFEGDGLSPRGEEIQADGKRIGEVTSSSWSPALQRVIGLGYVHRDFVSPGTRVSVHGTAAQVTALPFVVRSRE
jgi:folate-binding protein YgfZ